jgi:hypothetical protein
MIAEKIESESPSPPLLYGIEDLSDAGRRKLMDTCARRAAEGLIADHLSCIRLARRFPETFPDGVGKYLRDLVTFLIGLEDPGAVYSFTALQWNLDVPHAMILPELRRLADEMERRKVVIPTLAYFMDKYNPDPACGSNMANAYRQLLNPEYTLCPPRYVNREQKIHISGGYADQREYALEWLNDRYKRKCKKALMVDSQRPKRQKEHANYWASEERLYALEDSYSPHRSVSISSAELVGDEIYLMVRRRAGVRDQVPGYTAIRVGLRSGTSREVCRIDTGHEFAGKIHVGSQFVYLPGSKGVLMMPRDGGHARILERGKDYVDAAVNAIIESGGSLYLGCCYRAEAHCLYNTKITIVQEGYLLRSELDGKNMSVVASSARREKLSCLDNCAPYMITGFLEDTPRDRIIFVTGGHVNEAKDAIYALDMKQQHITRLCGRTGTWMHGPRAWREDTFLVGDGHGNVRVWNCATDTYFTLISDKWPLPKKVKGFHQTSASIETVALLNDVFYTVEVNPQWQYNRSRRRILISITQGQSASDSTPILPFKEEAPFILRTWNGKLVACTSHELWLLEPKMETVADSGTDNSNNTWERVPSENNSLKRGQNAFIII